jgi:hypothetical protein
MTDDTKHGNPGHGDFERSDLSARAIFYFLGGLILFGVLTHFVVAAVYDFLEKRSNAEQTSISPLVTSTPTDTRHISSGYPQAAFPNPRLEEDERGQLNGIRLSEDEKLDSYGYVDEQAGTVRIPIERAMELIAHRGLPVRAQGAATSAETPHNETAAADKAKTKSKKGGSH